MGIRKIAGILLELSAEYHDEEHWLGAVHGCLRVAADPANDVLSRNWGFSFRYGGTYLSASRETAAHYALLYRQGGEALTYTMKLHRLLLEVRPELLRSEEMTRLCAFAEKPGTPLVVEANGIELRSLRAEQGGTIDELITYIENALGDTEFYDDCVGQLNFELTGAVPMDRLKFYEVSKVHNFDEVGASETVLRFSAFTP